MPLLGRFAGLIISGLLLSVVVLMVAWLSIRWMGAANDRQALAIGGLWLSATLAFEFGFRLGIQRKPLKAVLDAYSFAGGNLWPLVLGVILMAPYSAHRIRNR